MYMESVHYWETEDAIVFEKLSMLIDLAGIINTDDFWLVFIQSFVFIKQWTCCFVLVSKTLSNLAPSLFSVSIIYILNIK